MQIERRMATRDRREGNTLALRVGSILRAPVTDDIEEEPRRPAFARELIAGVQAGQVAGFAMVATLMVIFSVLLNKSVFDPLQIIAASVLGEGAIERLDARTLVVGILVHQLGPALLWGLIFGVVVWLFNPRHSLALMTWGLVVGAIAQIVDAHGLLPLLSGAFSDRFSLSLPLPHENFWARVPMAASWLAHLVYGLALSLYPWKYDPIARSFG